MISRSADRVGPDVPRFRFTSTLYTTESFGSIAFLALPESIADRIEALPVLPRRGFGSRRVQVSATTGHGSHAWTTSIFPGAQTYVLPIKQAVRKACGVDVGDELTVEIVMLDWA